MIVTDGDILVIGSQSILGTYSEDQLPDAADGRHHRAGGSRSARRHRTVTDPTVAPLERTPEREHGLGLDFAPVRV